MMDKAFLRKSLVTSSLTIVLLFGFNLSSALAGNIEARSSSGIMDSDGATPLIGDGFAGLGEDYLIQCLYAGQDGVIDAADVDGSPTGDDVLLETSEFPGQYSTVIGEGFPFNPNQGRFVEDFTHSLGVGDQVYCRAWNGLDPASATCYGDSGLYAIQDSNFDSVDFGTWATDNCQGVCEPDVQQSCNTGEQGVCAAGTQTCGADGFWGLCIPDEVASLELCDGLDNDCDGEDDEDFPFLGDACTAGQGACEATGTFVCAADGSAIECDAIPGIPAIDDSLCNGVDDDCDGDVDEEYVPTPTMCGLGECASIGQIECQNGSEIDTCVEGSPISELCDGLDNDCDDVTDEDFYDLGMSCTEGLGACEANGTLVCSTDGLGTECNAIPGTPAADDSLCNSVDDDCDGSVDEDYVTTPTSCGQGECASTGQLECQNGSEVDTCTAGTGAAELCDGLDNDCDSVSDEDFPSLGQACTVGTGACEASGTFICAADGSGAECSATAGTPAADDTLCNGIDDDCDGSVDEDYVTTPTSCGQGECASTGQLECQSGSEVDTCTAGTGTAELCDGLDNDCDGASDEDFPTLGQTCTVGQGACEASGTIVCAADGSGAVCDANAGTPAADDSLCNSIDDDCDGSVDEDYVTTPTSCGQGECAATGQLECQNGSEVDTCVAGTGTAELCDSVDNDCDGVNDEDFSDLGTSCTVGQGACEATGTYICTADGSGTECDATAGTPAADDSLCNNIDDDCDGSVDEDYVPTPTSCGQGECASTGQMQCQGGVEVDTCVDGSPLSEICDGLDNNCDGATDEDFYDLGTSCTVGQGACEASGTYVCAADGLGTQCDAIPATPAADDSLCNDVDDDCDGSVDEDFVPAPTSCGQGGCASSGQLECQFGVEVDTCTPGTPDPEICDGIDNDCDGVADGSEDITQQCGDTGVGECEFGIETCDDSGNWINCTAIFPEPELCDGLDNNCDGLSDPDTDSDGALDCDELCDEDPLKTEPGNCGCGVPETACQVCTFDADCNDGNPCTDSFCVDSLCEYVNNTAPCSNGLFCDGVETCHAGECVPGMPLVLDDGVFCTEDSCDEEEDQILHIPNDALCDDTEFCNGTEICDPNLDCQSNAPPQIDDGNECTFDYCDENVDVVVHDSEPYVGDLCEGDTGICLGDGSCLVECFVDTDCFDGVGCSVDWCDTTQTPSRCVYNADDTLCDDGEFCNGTETCDAALDCQPGAAPEVNDGNECTEDYCDENSDIVVHDSLPHVNDLCMNDVGSCQEDGSCLVICELDEQCDDGIDCTTDWCDLSQSPYACAHNSDDAFCDDEEFCNGAEVCDGELGCQPGLAPELDDGNECTGDYCDEDGDVVVNDPDLMNDLECQNNTGICEDGVCVSMGETVVEVDIQPGTCPNSLNIKSKGVLPVAVLGHERFDVSTIDVGSILLSRKGLEDGVAPIRYSYEDVATPFEGELCDCHDLNGDGYLDLTLKFSRAEIVETLGLNGLDGQTIPLTLTGNQEDDGRIPITGEDCVRINEK